MDHANIDLSIDPDISKANTLDTVFYTDPYYFEKSKEKIFAKSWHFIGDDTFISGSENCHPFILLENYLNEPLLLTKQQDGQIHCLSNVCTHRGTVLIAESCQVNHLRCRYHGRQFRLDGEFLSMPEFKEVKNFPSEQDNLVRLPLLQWGPLLFASLKKDVLQDKYFSAMRKRMEWLPLNEFIYRPLLSSKYIVKSHWALYCENYLEGFHIPFVHAGLNAVIDFGNYTTEIFESSNLQLGLAKPGERVFDLPSSSPDFGKQVAAYYFFVFPNMMFNFYPWGLSINLIEPQGIDVTQVSFYTYVWKEDFYNTGAGAGLDIVEMEDEEVVEAVQQGIRSRFYHQGRYSVNREQGIHHFHRLVAEAMQS